MAPGAGGFAGKVVLITGGTSGIGLGLGRELARRGASVVLAGRRQEIAEAEAEAIRVAGGRAEAVRLDVTDAASFATTAQDVARRHGRLDYLFNNAGVAIAGDARKYDLEDWNHVLGVNRFGVRVTGVCPGFVDTPILYENMAHPERARFASARRGRLR